MNEKCMIDGECWPNYHHQSVLVVVIQSSLSSLFAIRTTFFFLSAIIKLYQIRFHQQEDPMIPTKKLCVQFSNWHVSSWSSSFFFSLIPSTFFFLSKSFVYYLLPVLEVDLIASDDIIIMMVIITFYTQNTHIYMSNVPSSFYRIY